MALCEETSPTGKYASCIAQQANISPVNERFRFRRHNDQEIDCQSLNVCGIILENLALKGKI